MKLRPLHDWVVIVRDAPVTSALWVHERLSNQGNVVAVGPKVKDVLVGDCVQFNRYSGFEVVGQGCALLFVNEAEISFVF